MKAKLFVVMMLCVSVFAIWPRVATAQEAMPPSEQPADSEIQFLQPSLERKGLETVFEAVNLRNQDLPVALRMMAERSGVNIAIGKDVAGNVTCSLNNVTAGTALEAFLRSNGYKFVSTGGVLVVAKDTGSPEEAPLVQQLIVRKSFTVPYSGREKEFVAGVTSFGASATSIGIESTISKMLSPSGKMVYYEHQHLLIVEDTEQIVATIEQFVDALWETPVQVFIDSKLVEVTLEEGENLGLRWDIVQKVGSAGNRSVSTGAATNFGTTFETAGPTMGLDRAFTFGIVNANIEAIVEALESRERVDLHSNPRILVANHRTASIVVGQEIPYLSSVESSGSNPIRTYEFKEVAVRLDVTPHVKDDGTVFLDIHPAVKSVIGYTDDPRQPILSTREAVTNVAVQDGSTLVIGGLVQRNISKSYAEVPYLARIPLLGLLFRQKQNSDTKNDLLFIMTPHVLRPELTNSVLESKKHLMAEPPVHAGETPDGRPKW